jgi:hypothetical protein
VSVRRTWEVSLRAWVTVALLLGACGGKHVGRTPIDSGRAEAGDVPAKIPAFHRPIAMACPPQDLSQAKCDAGVGDCTMNSDCHVGLNPRCVLFKARNICTCAWDTCAMDSDCRDAGPCACNSIEIGDLCVDGNCYVDADCGTGGFCSPSFDLCRGQIDHYYCHTPKDDCTDDADCAGARGGGSCTYNTTDSRWECLRTGCL